MGFISAPVNENITPNSRSNRYQPRPQHIRTEATYSRPNTRLDHTHIDSNPLLKSLYDQVDSMLQQSSGQDVTKIFFAVLSAVDKNLSNPNSPLSMNSDANDLRRLYNSIPPNGRMNLTISLMRSPQRSTSASSSPLLETEDKDEEIIEEDFPSYSSYRFDSDLLPPPPETWSDSDMTSLIDQAIEAEKMENLSNTQPLYSAYGAYR